MEEQLISFDTAKLAKEKGFTQDIFKAQFCLNEDGRWRNTTKVEKSKRIFAPTQSLLQRWLREEYNIMIEVIPHREEGCEKWKAKEDIYWEVLVDYYGKDFEIHINNECDYNETFLNSYEKALEKGLYEALKLIE